MTSQAAPPPRALPPPRAQLAVNRLTVLYDPACSLCAFVRNWLVRQRQLVPLDPVPAGSDEALRRFPGLDHAGTLREITVVGDGGQVYRGATAWVVCLWALAEYRPMSHRFSTPAGAPLAKAAVLAAAKYRKATAKPTVPAGVRGPAWGGPPPGQAYGPGNAWRYDPAHGWVIAPQAGAPPTGAPGPCTGGCAAPD